MGSVVLGVRTYVSVVEDDERVLRMLGCDDGNAHAETYAPGIGMYEFRKEVWDTMC